MDEDSKRDDNDDSNDEDRMEDRCANGGDAPSDNAPGDHEEDVEPTSEGADLAESKGDAIDEEQTNPPPGGLTPELRDQLDPLGKPWDQKRFVSRMLIGSVVALVLGVGWYMMQSQRLARQDIVANRLESLGGAVHFDTEFDDTGNRIAAEQQSPGLLAQSLGVDLFRRIEGVTLKHPLDEDSLAVLHEIGELRYLSLTTGNDMALEMERLARLKQLQRIELRQRPRQRGDPEVAFLFAAAGVSAYR